jgi:hypothetical protein
MTGRRDLDLPRIEGGDHVDDGHDRRVAGCTQGDRLALCLSSRMGTRTMQLPKTDLCRFKEGDLIQHQVFGLGTVAGAPQSLGEASPPDGEAMEGWLVPVRWHDSEHPASVMMDSALEKVASSGAPSSDGVDTRWRSLLLAWTTARRLVEEAYSTIRSSSDRALLREALEKEERAREAMEQFLAEDRQGRQ